MAKEKKQDIKRNIVWVALLCVAFLLQTTDGLRLSVGNVTFLWVLPVLSCVCMFEKEKLACWYGLFAGLLLDVVSPSMVGYNALVLLLICTFIGWISTNYLRNTLLTNLVMGSLLIFLSESLYWLFFVEFKNTAGASGIYFGKFLPTILVNIVLIVPVFFIVLAVNRHFKRNKSEA